jgi:hypothetical protein
MKTFIITRLETIRETQIVKAKTKKQAEEKADFENYESSEVLSSEIENVEEVKI